MKMNKIKVNWRLIRRKMTSFAILSTIVLSMIPLDMLAQDLVDDSKVVVHAAAANSRKASLTFYDMNELVAYSNEYVTNAELYSEDTITLSLSTNVLPESFVSLGTEDWPFNGEIYINQPYGQSWYFDIDKPLFSYVTDTVSINYSAEDHNTEPIQLELRKKHVDSTQASVLAPLFAEHVIDAEGDSAEWKIKAAPYEDSIGNISTYNFSGLIGDMGNYASVTIDFANDSYSSDLDIYSDIVSSSDIGLICGKMTTGSQITLTVSGTNNYYDVSSTESGNAGGLVGKMEPGSVLSIEGMNINTNSSRTIETVDGYAGGLVGYCDGGLIELPVANEGEPPFCVDICETIIGTTGAGGLFGYYSNPVTISGETVTAQSIIFDLSNYSVDCTVSANSSGGLFGVLHGAANVTIDGTSASANAIDITGDTIMNFGGIAGAYSTTSLGNSFSVNGVTADTASTFTGVSYYGGVFGWITGDNAAYVNVNNFTHNSSSGFDSATAFGGVVGNAGDKGSMLDVGTVTIATCVDDGEGGSVASPYIGGGIVGILTDGVLRLSGTTNLQNAPSSVASADHNNGQLVGIRKDSLVYAVGSGTGDGWIFNRSTSDVLADDIGTWGSVLRTDSTNLPDSSLESQDQAYTGVIDFDTSSHIVRIASPVTTITDAVTYTKTALNMQLNSGNKGALTFEDSVNNKTALLSTNITFSGTVNLSGTGNIGLTRDDYYSNSSEVGVYTGTISGGTVNLVIGERYAYSDASPVGRGAIIGHRYNGLIAFSGANTTFSGITIGGSITVDSILASTCVGGAVAQANNGITLTNVVANETITLKGYTDGVALVGGLVGNVSSDSANAISVTGGTISATINASGAIGEGDSATGKHSIGGLIGRVSSNKSFNITVNGLTLSPTISTSGVSQKDISAAGLIADIVGGGSTRTLSITDLTVTNASITNTATSHAGGLLGMHWLNTKVQFTYDNGVKVSGTNTLVSNASYVAGLVQCATGHWIVPKSGISITGLTITGASNSLGLIVHDGYSGSNGLYLELTDKDSYDLGTGLTIPNSAKYDELVLSTGSDILANGSNGIISITTDSDLIMNGANCNTYQNKYNQSTLTNNKSRYYYNLTSIGSKATKSDGENLLLWSLEKYAASNIKGNFVSGISANTLTGTFDMEHLSYYPIDIDSDNVTIEDATFIFYNSQIESSENGTGNGDGGVRTTRGASQHYLMHSGLFRNVSKVLTTSGDVHFKGSIGVGVAGTTSYSGVLINGTLSGTLTTDSSGEIVFEGLTISDSSKYLFINKMTTNSKLVLNGVRTGGGKDFNNVAKSSETRYPAGSTIASSLIGSVSGNGIQVSFDRIKLDSRTVENAPTDLSSVYGTTKSIFSGATLLDNFSVDNNSIGTYNFTESEDWDGSTHNANVTYGKEIKTSVEYANKEQHYYGSSASYVDPENDPTSRTSVYSFDNGFLPYVKTSTATTGSTRELKVNVYTAGLGEGCGTYNDPYQITDGQQLADIAATMNKSDYMTSLRLPIVNCNNDSNLTNLNNLVSKHWCDGDCAEFTLNGDYYEYNDGTTTYKWTKKQVSLYLASAYYIIKKDIDLDENFIGLGTSPANDTTGDYAFRGVIVGASSDGSTKITNKSKRFQTISGNTDLYNTKGLISTANGCVVKDLTIEVDFPDSDKYQYRSNANKAYAYNEEFPNYGAVINKIMGGDNIIDNVSVEYIDTFKIYQGNDYKATVGGFVGCVVNGGLIFRNVNDDSLVNFVVKKANDNGAVQSVTCNGETITNLTSEEDLIHIHVNPFVGRVINGYAMLESDHYAFSEDGETYGDGKTRENAVEVTVHNTRKNYSIPDIDTTNSNGVLTFTQSASGGAYDTINIPDGQAMYIMSLITQSGAGCAVSDDGNYKYNISYCGNNARTYSGNRADNYKATHLAHYDNVGVASDPTDSDYVISKLDKVNNREALPYIIYKYSDSYENNGDKYPARCMTYRTFFINLVGGNTYYLPDSFRGLGFLGSNELDDNMKIYGLNGNGTDVAPTVIDVNSEYFTHLIGDDPYYSGASMSEYQMGIGLFNNLKQVNSFGDTNSTYDKNPDYQINSFVLQGYLSAHHVNSSNGKDQIADHGDSRDVKVMRTAGFVPNILSSNVKQYNFSNINFKNLHINSYSYAGGFVAYANASNSAAMVYINNCNADGFEIEGAGRVAGFVGTLDANAINGGIHINTGLDENNVDSCSSVMKNTIINNRFTKDNKMNYSAGVVGCVYTTANYQNIDTKDNAYGNLIIRNVTIEGGDPAHNYIGNKSNPMGSSGGIVGGGTGSVQGCLIINCVVKNIDIYGRHAGGIFGENANRKSNSGSKTGAKIYGCTVYGDLDENGNPQYSIMALQYAGGVYGDTRDSRNNVYPKYKSVSAGDTDYVQYKNDIDGVLVYGYNIYSMNKSNENQSTIASGFAAGGITGNNENDRYIQNCKVEKCIIDVGSNASSASNTPCGGLIGRMATGTLYGYNIEVNDCDYRTHQWNSESPTNTQPAYNVSSMYCGNAIGNCNSKTINLIAYHTVNCPIEKDFNNRGSSSFIVYADYLSSASTSQAGTEMSTLTALESGMSNVSEGGRDEYFPHVNVSPVVDMGSNAILTSDGAALYTDNGTTGVSVPVIDAVVSGTDYSTPGSSVKNYVNNALSAGDDSNKISTYLTEMGSLPAGVDDFAVVVINTETQVDSTNLINNYIKMITNTSNDYTADSSGKYKIKIYPCTFDSTTGNYVINASGKIKGLNYSSEQKRYYMANGYADSNQGDYQFSLIDVQYLNPSNANEVAYHLYVPVLTRKMLMFGFESASLSGTDIKSSNFDNYGNTLAESLDSWYTGYVHYTYKLSELQSLLDNGTGLDWNNDKVVQFKYTTTSVAAKLGGDTQIVLVNPYNSDRYYYSTLSQLRGAQDSDGEKDTLAFESFNTKLDGSGNSFTSATLKELMDQQGFTITAVTGSQGQSGYVYSVTSDSSEAKITVNGVMYKYVGEGNGNVKLVVAAPAGAEMSSGSNPEAVLKENYYISVRASGNSVYNYSIRTPATISGGASNPTIRVSNLNENKLTKIIMGNLYTQTFTTSVRNNSTSSLTIDATNHRLDVTMLTSISLAGTSEDKDFILTHLANDNIHLYHSFIVKLTAKDSSGERTKVLGEPNISVTYTFNGREDQNAYNLNSFSSDADYIQLRNNDIKQYLSKNNSASIKAVAYIDFDEAWKYNLEFPSQDGSDPAIGVNVSAVSNLSYNEESIAYSNMTAQAPANSNYYYVKDAEEAALVYNMKSGILDAYDIAGAASYNYSQQGVNPKNFIDQDQTTIPLQTVATYDATAIKHSEFSNAAQIKYSLILYKKTGDYGNVNYVRVSDIGDYFDLTDSNSVFIKVNTGVTSGYASGGKMTASQDPDFDLVYVATLDQSVFDRQEDQLIDADINFTAITGEGFDDYANYRVVLKVDLLKSDGTPVNQSTNATDWVVYTNARINPNMVTLAEENGG